MNSESGIACNNTMFGEFMLIGIRGSLGKIVVELVVL